MNDLLISVVLGIIEGITEFLPISSTAHLRIAEHLFNLPLTDPFWKMYSIVIQLGAVLCLPIYFRKRISDFLKSFPWRSKSPASMMEHPLARVMVAFVCTVVPVLLLKKVISTNLESLTVIGGAMVIGGAVMWAVDALFTHPRTVEMEKIGLLQAIWIGLLQSLAAIFPGTSRSMITIAAGQSAGLSRSAALEFSFFLSIPTMAAACLHDLYKSLRPGKDDLAGMAPLHITGQQWLVLVVGFVVSFFVAWVVVAWFMHWVRRRGFVPFAIYRIIVGILVLTLLRHG